jgi:hypothetical protein
MDRTVETILAVWRELERELETATDADIREDLQTRIVVARDAHREAVEKRIALDEPGISLE